MLNLLKPYVLYVALYLGVALTGGSVVHLPLNPPRYLLIGAIGVLVFIVASVADARPLQARRMPPPGGGMRRAWRGRAADSADMSAGACCCLSGSAC